MVGNFTSTSLGTIQIVCEYVTVVVGNFTSTSLRTIQIVCEYNPSRSEKTGPWMYGWEPKVISALPYNLHFAMIKGPFSYGGEDGLVIKWIASYPFSIKWIASYPFSIKWILQKAFRKLLSKHREVIFHIIMTKRFRNVPKWSRVVQLKHTSF